MSGWRRIPAPQLLLAQSPKARAWQREVLDGHLSVFAGPEHPPMSVTAADRDQLRRVLATRRCRDLDHAPPKGPREPGLEATCNRCVAWADRRVEELERAGLIRTAEDRTNATALTDAHRLLASYRRDTAVAVCVAAVCVLVVVAREVRRRWAA